MTGASPSAWHVGWNDHSGVGLAIAALYALAALLALVAMRRAAPRERLPWLLVALFLIALGLNKQLDLHTWLTQALRDVASRDGWYQQRRLYQKLFILGGAGVAGAASLWLLWMMRRFRPALRGALLGVIGLLFFMLIRAASFHHSDVALSTLINGTKLRLWLELAALLLVAISAAVAATARSSAAGTRRRAPRSRPG